MVANAKNTNEIIRSFVDFCNGYILVGHNIMFDYKFMKIGEKVIQKKVLIL